MKTPLYILLFSLLALSCEKEPATLKKISNDETRFYTDAPSYHKKDSIDLFLENNSSFDLITGLRCGKYLEMGYQMKEKDQWSGEKYFWYMQLGCPTFPDTIQANSTYSYKFPATLFDTTGTFRLFLSVYVSENDISLAEVSNSFEIF